MSLLALPKEVVLKLISYFRVHDLINLACCSSCTQKLVRNQLWKRVKIPSSRLYDLSSVRQFIQYIEHSSDLCFEDTNWGIPEEQTHVLENFEYVLRCCDPVKIFSFELQAEGCWDSWGAGLEDLLSTHLTRFNNLKELEFHVSIRMETLLPMIFESLPNIQTLLLDNNLYGLPKDGFAGITKLTKLKKLTVVNKETFWDFPSIICHLNQLQELNLTRCEIIDFSVISICNTLLNLQVLELVSCNCLRNQCLNNIYMLTSLKKLKVRCWRVEEESLNYIQQVPSLHCLDINYMTLSQKGLTMLSRMCGLRKLSLSSCAFKNEDLSHLVQGNGLDQLRELNVSKCKQLDNVGLKSIGKLKSLRLLHMYGCPIAIDFSALATDRICVDYVKDISF